MQNDARRADILTQLSKSQKPVSATALAERYHLSRQSIVGDIALLRAAGNDIIATSRGYLLATPLKVPFLEKTIACRHNAAAMREELYIAVDEGCTVADVVVEHPLYGELRGQLQLSTRHEVNEFLARCGASEALHSSSHPPLPRRGSLRTCRKAAPCCRYPALGLKLFRKTACKT